MPDPPDQGKDPWPPVHHQLLHHAIPDSRFDLNFADFVPDFRGSSSAIDRLLQLPCYQSSTTILVTPDNSLEHFRYRALKDGKKLLVGTYGLRRGFVLLDPRGMDEDGLRMASLLDAMERDGVGRAVTLAKLQEDAVRVDMCVVGALVVSRRGRMVRSARSQFGVQWGVLVDRGVLGVETLVAAVVHGCQIVDEESQGFDKRTFDRTLEVQCDFVISPEETIQVENAIKPDSGIVFEKIPKEMIDTIQPLQELRGIKMMEDIMKTSGFGQEKEKLSVAVPSAEEQMGIDMVERIMRGFKS